MKLIKLTQISRNELMLTVKGTERALQTKDYTLINNMFIVRTFKVIKALREGTTNTLFDQREKNFNPESLVDMPGLRLNI